MIRRFAHGGTTLLAVGMLIVLALFLMNRELARDLDPPRDDVESMTEWIARHPADWLTLAAIADRVLDSPLPARREIWRGSHALAVRLAPLRRNTAIGFVRGGLAHWYELGEEDRRDVLAAAAPLMREPRFFSSMYKPLWELTRDFGWLRRVSPPTLEAHRALRDLALHAGRFDDYRELRSLTRTEALEQLEAKRNDAPMRELLALLPQRLQAADQPLVNVILEELDRRPFDVAAIDGRLAAIAAYAIRNELEPLRGLAPLAEAQGKVEPVTRARLALGLERPDLAAQIELTNASAASPEWTAYYLDRARYEAARGDAVAADSYLTRAALRGMTIDVLFAAEEVALALDNETEAAGYRRELMRRAAAEPRVWRGSCGKNELCDAATTREYIGGDEGTIRVGLSVIESDETPPWVEVYVDDVLVGEGPVTGDRTFEVNAIHGLHEIEVRIANRYTRNGVQRRLRLS
ncbi:MAG TPA: hypothetical protein VF701_09625 [Thermoanaerobaculia bacterium]